VRFGRHRGLRFGHCPTGRGGVTDVDRRTRQVVDVDDAAPDLRCAGCQSNHCQHVADTIRQIRHHLSQSGRLAGDVTARAQRQEQLHSQFQVIDRTASSARAQPEPPAVSFLSNPEAFRAVVQSAGPDRQVPFMTEDACHGLAATTRFGVELEFNGDSYTTRNEVADRLRTAGLIRRPSYAGYHNLVGWRRAPPGRSTVRR
jgi:hypothetical protein